MSFHPWLLNGSVNRNLFCLLSIFMSEAKSCYVIPCCSSICRLYAAMLDSIKLMLLPPATHFILYLQYRERVIFIGQNIDEEFSNQILATMLYLDSIDDGKRLYFYINGPGGDVSSSDLHVQPLLSSLISDCSLGSLLLAWQSTTRCKVWRVLLGLTVWAMPIIWQASFLRLERR